MNQIRLVPTTKRTSCNAYSWPVSGHSEAAKETGTMDSRNAAKAVIKEVPQKFETGHMNAHELLQFLTETHPNRMEQLTGPLGKSADSVQGLIDQLSDLHCDMAIANGKCGYVGNPYEKLEVDCAILLAASEKITGLKSRFPWQRT